VRGRLLRRAETVQGGKRRIGAEAGIASGAPYRLLWRDGTMNDVVLALAFVVAAALAVAAIYVSATS
jgi:hypothetical protein